MMVLRAAPSSTECSTVWQNICSDGSRQELEVRSTAVVTMGETVHGKSWLDQMDRIGANELACTVIHLPSFLLYTEVLMGF